MRHVRRDDAHPSKDTLDPVAEVPLSMYAVVVEEPVSDEVISECLGPSDAQRWRAILAADEARQAEQQQQQGQPLQEEGQRQPPEEEEGGALKRFSKAYAAML